MSRILRSFRVINASKQFTLSNSALSNRVLCTSSDDDKSAKKSPELNKPKKNQAIDRLNALLQQIVEADQQIKNTPDKLSLARPIGRNAKTEPGVKSAKVESVEKKIVSAVKDVAESIGGNKVQTESELLNRLMNGEDKMPTANLSDIVRGMKIVRETKADTSVSKAQQVRKLLESTAHHGAARQRNVKAQKPQRQPIIDAANAETVDIFGSEALGIFTKGQFKPVQQTMNNTWDKLYERELKLAVTHPPLNYFQEQILWTEQGKLWKFPIDNEQGMEKEHHVYFAEHVFLEEHLSPWCPTKGPLRHFMELVCVGLSKNPYMSVDDKREHIKWFENYFEQKKKLLKETGALPDEIISRKQLE